MKMTAKQQRFCDEYLIDLNATQAAIRSGYSKKTARAMGAENLTKPDIKSYIEQRMAEKEAALIADQNEVLKYLTAVLRGEEKDEKMIFGKDGVETFLLKNQENQMKAAELLGKRYGLYKETIDQNVDLDLNIKIDYGDDEGGEDGE